MNHGFKLHPDGTLEITMPKGKKVSRVLVCEAGTKYGTLMYPDCDDCIKHGEDWECSHVNCHKGKDVPDTNVSDMISRRAAIDAIMSEYPEPHYPAWYAEILKKLPSAEPEPAIPLSWIEGRIKWLKSLDNAFSTLTAVQISAMVNKWRGEQDERFKHSRTMHT